MADTLLTGTTLIEDKRTGGEEVLSLSYAAFIPQEPDGDDIKYIEDGEY